MLKSAKSEKNSAEGELKRIETKVANLEKDMEEKMAKPAQVACQSGEQKDQRPSATLRKPSKKRRAAVAQCNIACLLCFVDVILILCL
jgi:hypothetical protein